MKDIYQEDINRLTSDLVDSIQPIVAMTVETEDRVWDAIQARLEKFFNYPDYRSHL